MGGVKGWRHSKDAVNIEKKWGEQAFLPYLIPQKLYIVTSFGLNGTPYRNCIQDIWGNNDCTFFPFILVSLWVPVFPWYEFVLNFQCSTAWGTFPILTETSKEVMEHGGNGDACNSYIIFAYVALYKVLCVFIYVYVCLCFMEDFTIFNKCHLKINQIQLFVLPGIF